MDLARAMRARYSPPVAKTLMVTVFPATRGTDLAQFMGLVLTLNLFCDTSFAWAAVLTSADEPLVHWFECFGFRRVEIVYLAFAVTNGGAYVIEVFFAQPAPGAVT